MAEPQGGRVTCRTEEENAMIGKLLKRELVEGGGHPRAWTRAPEAQPQERSMSCLVPKTRTNPFLRTRARRRLARRTRRSWARR